MQQKAGTGTHVANSSTSLVNTLERWYGLALVLVQSSARNSAVGQLGLALRLLLEGQGVLHPVLVVSLGVVLAGVCATRFLSGGGGLGSLNAKILLGQHTELGSDITYAQVNRFLNSSVSTKSEFQIMLRSLVFTSGNIWSTSLIFLTPSSKLS